MAQTGYNATGGNVGSVIVNGALYRTHTFLTSGTFTPSSNFNIEYLVVGGGGGGGSDMGGGGGGGGYLAGTTSILAQAYSIVVGTGGAGAPAGINQAAANGNNTTAFGLTAIGGGRGASTHNQPGIPAGNGGSGGGGSGGRMSGSTTGGAAGTGTAGQGFAGAGSGTHWYPGGGGGAGAAATQTGTQVAHGGAGILNAILGPNYYWAGGGAGAGYSTFGGNGGLGGGGGGAPANGSTLGLGNTSGINPAVNATVGGLSQWANVPGGAGGANTGGGGGGGAHYNENNKGGDGGSGIVVARYLVDDDPRTLSIAGPTGTVGFGETFTFTVTTSASTVNGTELPYTISGLTSAEIDNASLTGNIVVTDQTATLEITLTQGSTFSFQTLTVNIDGWNSVNLVSNLASNTQPNFGGTASVSDVINNSPVIDKYLVTSLATTGILTKASSSQPLTGVVSDPITSSTLKIPEIDYVGYVQWFTLLLDNDLPPISPTTRQILIR